jgi:hypothetical protein
MSEYTDLLADLENTLATQRREGRRMLKSLSAGRARTRRRLDFGKTGSRHISASRIDLVKAETTLRSLDRAGLLTKAQSSEAWSRLMALRPTEIVRIK